MIVVGRFYCDTRYDLDHHFKWFQPNVLNLDLSGTTTDLKLELDKACF